MKDWLLREKIRLGLIGFGLRCWRGARLGVEVFEVDLAVDEVDLIVGEGHVEGIIGCLDRMIGEVAVAVGDLVVVDRGLCGEIEEVVTVGEVVVRMVFEGVVGILGIELGDRI